MFNRNELKQGVRIKNGAGHSVSFTVNGKLRMMDFADVELTISEEDIEALYNNKGGRSMIEKGILIILDNEIRERFNLEPIDEYMLDSEGFKKMFKEKNIEKIKDFLTYCSDSMADRAVDEAIKNRVSDYVITSLIQKATGKDIKPLVEEQIEKETKTKSDKGSTDKKTKTNTKGKKAKRDLE